jgi:hypothetical protein
MYNYVHKYSFKFKYISIQRLIFSKMIIEIKQIDTSLESYKKNNIENDNNDNNDNTNSNEKIEIKNGNEKIEIKNVNEIDFIYNDLYEKCDIKVSELKSLLRDLLQIASTLGFVFLLFGPLYSRLLIQLIFNKKYQNEESVKTLSAVCINVFILSINGITEAFVQIVASKSTYKQVNTGYFFSSLLYIILIKFFITEFGTSGLVLAGSLSMIIRILTSFYVIYKVFDNFEKYEKNGKLMKNSKNISDTGNNKEKKIIPFFFQLSVRFILSLIIIWLILYISSNRFFNSTRNVKSILEHIFIGGVGFLSLGGVLISILSKSNQEKIFRFIPFKKTSKN